MVHMAQVPGAEDGDLVVITSDDDLKGSIGKMKITPGWETVEIVMGCLHVRRYPRDVRPLKLGEKVMNP